MSDEEDDSKLLTRWGVVAGVAGYIVFAITLLIIAGGLVVNSFVIKGNVSVWFFFVTVLAACLVADSLTLVSDKLASLMKGQVFTFHKFLLFALSILAGAVAGEYLYNWMLDGLINTPLSIGVGVAVVIIVVLPALVFFDFFLRGKYHFPKPTIVDIPMTKETMAMLEAERKKRMLRSIPETIRVLLSEHLSQK